VRDKTLNASIERGGYRQKKSKKSLAMPAGIVTNGVILRDMGETMREFKTRLPRTFPFRLPLVLAGALLLLAAFAPRANANCPGCIRFYDMEAPVVPGEVVGRGSHPPAIEQGNVAPFAFLLQNDDGTPYTVANISAEINHPVGAINFPAGANPNSISMGFHSSGQAHLNIVMTFPSVAGIYDIQSVSFASRGSGNGFQQVTLQISSNGGATWTNASVVTDIPSSDGTIVLNNTLFGSTLGIPNLLVRLHFENGQSNGGNLQNVIDNIQVNGTVVPEPATVAGGLFGVLGLCWHQRRRLIRSVRFRRT